MVAYKSGLFLILTVCVALSHCRGKHDQTTTSKSDDRERREILDNHHTEKSINWLESKRDLQKRGVNASLPGLLDLGVLGGKKRDVEHHLRKRGVNASLPGVLDLGVLGGKKRDVEIHLNKRGVNASLPGLLDLGVLGGKKRDVSHLTKRGVNLSLPGLIDLGLLGGKKRRSATTKLPPCSDELEDGSKPCIPKLSSLEKDDSESSTHRSIG